MSAVLKVLSLVKFNETAPVGSGNALRDVPLTKSGRRFLLHGGL